MKKIFMSRVFIAPLVLVLLGCSGGSTEPSIMAPEAEDPLQAFDNFPDSLFHGIYFGQPTLEARSLLESQHYQILDSSGAWRYFNDADSTELLIPLLPKINSLKIILSGADYLNNMAKLQALFESKSISADLSPEFDIYEFETAANKFKLSIFKQTDYIRLSFELRTSK
jgi:hypothetical protein